jgi:hypothetical protein
MSLLGKILAFLNIIGAAGFVYLASLDYAKRHTWAAQVFRADLLLQGLPLDAEARTPEGEPIVDLITEDTKKALFPVPPAVFTQEDEVRRVQSEVQSRIQAAGTDTDKILAASAPLLLPFAETNSQRDLLIADLALGDPAKAAKIKKALTDAGQAVARPPVAGQPALSPRDAWAEALSNQGMEAALPFVDGILAAKAAKPNAAIDQLIKESLESQKADVDRRREELFRNALDQRNQTPDLRRRTIARLLYGLYGPLFGKDGAINLADSGGPFQRLVTIVGLRTVGQAIRDEAQSLAALIPGVETERGRERTLFAVEHKKLLDQIREKAQQVAADTELLKRKEDQRSAHAEQLRKRAKEVKDYEEELAKSRTETAERYQELRKMTADLYKIRVELRDKAKNNQDLEKEIRSLEAGR